MPALRQYIKEKYSCIETDVFLEYSSGAYLQDIELLLDHIHVEENTHVSDAISPILVSKCTCCYYNEMIDLLIEYMILKKRNNSLLLGLTKYHYEVDNTVQMFKGFNSSLALLKSKPMEIIMNILGITRFLSLILGTDALWRPNNFVIWGDIKEMPFSNKVNPNIIFGGTLTETQILNKTIPKRLRKVRKIIKLMIFNHNKHAYEYPYIVDQICKSSRKLKSDNLGYATDRANVIRLIHTLIYMIIPMEIFGSNHNRTVLMRYKFKSRYFTKHLYQKRDSSNSFKSFKQNEDTIGSLSIHPKKTDFRLIAKPFKGTLEERILYLSYQKRKLRPINQILNHIRLRNSCSSVRDIVKHIYSFKSRITKPTGKLPRVYAFKFDVQNAYDSLPHAMIDKVIKQRLDAFTKSDTVFVQLCRKSKTDGVVRTRKSLIADSLEKLKFSKDFGFSAQHRLVDTHETLEFSKKDIINFARSQYAKTCITINSKSYFRKIGVFQGFPLSATLFNIVYDSMVEKLKSIINFTGEMTVIRLMDDFLVLSTSDSDLRKIRKFVSRTVADYNMNINRLKSNFTNDKLLFAGLTIDVKNLVCYKPLKQYNTGRVIASNFTKLYAKLTEYTDIWVGNTLLFDSTNVMSGKHGCRKNVVYLLRALLFKFVNSFRETRRRSKFKVQTLFSFLNKTLCRISEITDLVFIQFDFANMFSI
ncbi:hypothetical protein JL09_g1125 [Pichia kudriavzevii]|uniref:Telomerase reverse transcriptase n=1 Tax=Pichia kudriavzevii TaxID=4909 RepID=A0A099P684_PICKU|nr:hypothetical protein JL09_g1125 [Pichia kudriavzevii]